MVGNLSSSEVAGSDRQTIEDENKADGAFSKAGQILKDLGEKGEGHEGATIAECRHAKGQ